MSSQKQLDANRANSLLSTGPTSPAGKAKVKYNALKFGLTGHSVLLPTEDATLYQAHTEQVFKLWLPEGDEEKRLTKCLADALWRLERIPSFESAIFAVGRRELASLFEDEEDEAVRKLLLDGKIFLTYRRDLNSLSSSETRIRRQYDKDETELKRLIAERKAVQKAIKDKEDRRWSEAIANFKDAKHHGVKFDPAEIGFEFSIEEIERREEQQRWDAVVSSARYYEYKAKGYDLPRNRR